MQNTMKHIWMLLLPLAVLVASCHRDEPTKMAAMGFTSSMARGGEVTPLQGAPVRRSPMGSTPLEEIDVKSFRVWCYKTMSYNALTGVFASPQEVMKGYYVNWTENTAGTTTSNTADWEYVGIDNSDLAGGKQTIKYWDFGATSYRFFGFAPSDRLTSPTNFRYPANHGDGFTWFDMTFDADATDPDGLPYISKLWYSDNAGDNKYGGQVVMEFMKPVTQVGVKVVKMDGTLITNPEAEGISYMKFSKGGELAVQDGTLTVSYPVTGSALMAFYTPKVSVAGSKEGKAEIPGSLDVHYSDLVYVLPHVEQDAYQMEIRVGGGETKVATVPAKYMSWQPNMKYIYVFKLTDDDFQFIDIVQIGVTEWIVEGSTHPFYNW